MPARVQELQLDGGSCASPGSFVASVAALCANMSCKATGHTNISTKQGLHQSTQLRGAHTDSAELAAHSSAVAGVHMTLTVDGQRLTETRVYVSGIIAAAPAQVHSGEACQSWQARHD